MKRRIELWIDGARADISDQGLILFNYAFADLTRPTAVKNSFSKQITLPGTPENAKIFGHIARVDRITADAGFNPLVRTPFVIYNEMQEVLEAGYLKLDSVTRKGPAISGYKVTLYGGLGSFFYGLMYNAEGEERKLYDMDYVMVDHRNISHPVDITETITAANLRTAWANINWHNMDGDTEHNLYIHRVLNWIPCYNGIPDDFDADTFVVKPSTAGAGAGTSGGVNNGSVGIPVKLQDEDGTEYFPYNGWALIKLSDPVNEWEARDLRSYLQRPALNIKAFLDSLSLPANNGGWTIDWQTRPDNEQDLWLTLKTLNTIDFAESATQEVEIDRNALIDLRSGITQEIQAVNGERGTTRVSLGVLPTLRASSNYGQLYCAYERYLNGVRHDTASNAMMIQAVGYDGSGNVVAHSDLVILSNATETYTANENAEKAFTDGLARSWNNFTPVGVTEYGTGTTLSTGYFQLSQQSGGYYYYTWSQGALALTLEGTNIRRVVVKIAWVAEERFAGDASNTGVGLYSATIIPDYSSMRGYYPGIKYGPITGTLTTTITAIRSGMSVTQAQFLNSDHTIADYLLSLAKIFGWVFTCDTARKVVTIRSRNGFFNTELADIDLSARIDRGKDITITPMQVASQYYKFSQEAVGGRAKKYKSDYAREYGAKWLNTGYEFDAADINQAEGIVFKQPVFWVHRSYNYTWPYIGNKNTGWRYGWEQYARTLVYGGNSETGFSQEMPRLYPTGWDSFNSDLPFADFLDKPQFCDDEGKAVDGQDCLVYMRPAVSWEGSLNYQITDDFDEMLYLNNGKPCWICAFDGNAQALSTIPEFSPYFYALDSITEGYTYHTELEWGLPLEIYDPYLQHSDEDNCLYARYWRAYMTDLLSVNTKVMKCRVDLSELQVGPELLRRFFYYEGSLWVLNKITNYSLTTYDPVECEFVQVQDKNNYTNGQNLD